MIDQINRYLRKCKLMINSSWKTSFVTCVDENSELMILMMTILEIEVICIVFPVFNQDGFKIFQSKFSFSVARKAFYIFPCEKIEKSVWVKQMYFACAAARNYKLKEDASYKRGILQRYFRPHYFLIKSCFQGEPP